MEGNIQFSADINQMVTQISDKLEQLIVAAGGKVEQAFPYMVKQAQIVGWMWVVSLCVFAVMSVGVISFAIGHWDTDTSYNICDSDHEVLWRVFCMVSTMGLFATLIGTLVTGIPHILNPEYYAIQDLMSLVR